MSFQKFQSDSFCVRGRHRSSTSKIYGGITSKDSEVLNGYCSFWNRKNSMTVSDNVIQAEGLGSFFKILARIYVNAGKKFGN